MKNTLYVFIIYLMLTSATTAVMHPFSFRYTLLLLVDAIFIDALYEPENGLTSPRNNPDLNRFVTKYGKRKIKEDEDDK